MIAAREHGGPFSISGPSFGGVLAVETASRLEERGHGPDMVFLFDTYLHRPAHRVLHDIMRNGWLTQKMRQGLKRMSRRFSAAPADESVLANARPMSEIVALLNRLRETASWTYGGPRRPLACPTVQFCASKSAEGKSLRLDPDPGWARVLGQNFSMMPMPGNHLTMVEKDHAHHLAAEIDRQIRLHPRPA